MGGILAFGYLTKAVLLAQLHDTHIAMTAMNEAKIKEVSVQPASRFAAWDRTLKGLPGAEHAVGALNA
jgi:hypothetical protein